MIESRAESPSSSSRDLEMKGEVQHYESEEQQYTPQEVDYILQRHGTLQLDPMPTNSEKDPLNWPELKKNYHLTLVGTQAMMTTFMAAGLVPAYETMAEEYGHPVHDISYLTSVQILIFGLFPSFWMPIMSKFGRRPVLTLGVLVATACNIGGGFCKTYGQQMATRVILSFFMCPALPVGTAVVAEVCFSHQRGSRNGLWAVLLTLGTPLGPFIMGFVQQHAGTHWVYWVFAIVNFIQFLGWLAADETLYLRGEDEGKGIRHWFGMITKTNYKFTLESFIAPLRLGSNYRVLVAAISHAIVFCYANIVLVVEMPEVFGKKFKLDAQQTGLQFIAIILGSLIGEIMSGTISDWWMNRRIKQRGGVKLIEDRLWMAYSGYILVIIGLIVWGTMLVQATDGEWTVKPLVGAAFAAAGNQVVTTPLITFAVDDNHKKAVEAGLFINIVRQIWAFIGPFYFPPMFNSLGFDKAAAVMVCIVAAVGAFPVIAVHIIGVKRLKKNDVHQ
ncbi:hypothetical protein TRICI_006603 [Trichomonascus ciferrii]|uniref:Major facilitator superfamily (MFS) profile domain-containing protein n=1 Tax=Trichomonascus ciferrii TaxID=44093 RepID=A0A642UG60_9ASCO|nr:hypothetical protein TRICI_006603 [Trichomonascus ciferrii]